MRKGVTRNDLAKNIMEEKEEKDKKYRRKDYGAREGKKVRERVEKEGEKKRK